MGVQCPPKTSLHGQGAVPLRYPGGPELCWLEPNVQALIRDCSRTRSLLALGFRCSLSPAASMTTQILCFRRSVVVWMKTKTNMEVMICTSSTRRWRGAPLGTETRHIWTTLAEDAVAINHSRFFCPRPFQGAFCCS